MNGKEIQITAVKSPAARKPRSPAVSFDELMATQAGAPRRYIPSDLFAAGDVLDHATFGRGLVSGLKAPGKVEVTFRTGVKTLVHGKR